MRGLDIPGGAATVRRLSSHPDKTRPGLAARLRISLVALAVTLLLLEAGTAVVEWTRTGEFPYAPSVIRAHKQVLRDQTRGLEEEEYRRPRLALHPYLGYVSNADLHQTHKGAANNRSGFFGEVEAVYRPADPNEYVVAVLGGAVAAQLCILGGEHLARALEALPPVRGRKAVIVPLCQGGYKQPQQLISFAYHYILGLHPDLVINIDGVNEMLFFQNNALNNHIEPTYPWNWPALIWESDRDVEVMRARLDIVEVREREAKRAAALLKNRLYKTALGRVVIARLEARDALIAALAAKRLEARMQELTEAAPTYLRTGPLHWTTDDFDEAMTESARVWREGGILLADMIRGRGIPYLHGLQPNQYFPGTRTLTEWERENAYTDDPASEFYLPLSSGYAVFTNEFEVMRREGVPIVDLTDYLGDPPITIYSDNFSHFNHDGNRLLAEAVAVAVGEMFDATSPALSGHAP